MVQVEWPYHYLFVQTKAVKTHFKDVWNGCADTPFLSGVRSVVRVWWGLLFLHAGDAGLSKPESMNCLFAQGFLLFLTSDAKWRRGEKEFGVYPLSAPRQPADLAHRSGLFVFPQFVNLITQMESELMQTIPACDWLPHKVVYWFLVYVWIYWRNLKWN